MARNIRTLLEHEAKRNQNLQSVLNKIDSYSNEMIENLPYKPWIKKALKLSKADLESDNTRYVNIDKILKNTRFFNAADPLGDMYEYTGFTRFIKLDRGELELKEGSLFWIPAIGNGIWYETIFSNIIDPNVTSIKIKQCTKNEYSNIYKDKLNNNAINSSKTIVNNPVFDSPLSQYGVKFSKL